MTVFRRRALLTNIPSRKKQSLNGKWQYIVDPYETGFYDYRFKERGEKDREAYWNTDKQANKTDRKEHGYIDKYSLNVPGDWNSQAPQFLYYEGTVWYKKSFDFTKADAANRVFLYFGAVNYRAVVYLNGKKLGMHTGGFTPFNFEIPDSVLKAKDNFLVVKVDNKRGKGRSAHREYRLVELRWHNKRRGLGRIAADLCSGFLAAIKKPAAGAAPPTKNAVAEGWVKLNGSGPGSVTVDIPELGVKKTVAAGGGVGLLKWCFRRSVVVNRNAKRYEVTVSAGADKLSDKIGFRTVEAYNEKVWLNGKPVFLRGISVHGEVAQQGRRAYSAADAALLLNEAKDLGCNMVRLAHYPHDESTTRAADSLGFWYGRRYRFTGPLISVTKTCFKKQRRS